MKNTNVCIKGDGSHETGSWLIKYLKSLGGITYLEMNGTVDNAYYFITKNNNFIAYTYEKPDGYDLIDLPKDKPEEKPLPKWMWVWDGEEEKAVKRYVVFRANNNHFISLAHAESEEHSDYQEYLGGSLGYVLYPYKHAKDIKSETENPLLKELEEMKQKIAEIFLLHQRIAEIEYQLKQNSHEN
jgi:hypothetical protein